MGRNHRTHEANILQLQFSTRSHNHHATCNLQHNSHNARMLAKLAMCLCTLHRKAVQIVAQLARILFGRRG